MHHKLGERFGFGEVEVHPSLDPVGTWKRVHNVISVFGIPVEEIEDAHFLGPVSPLLTGDTSGLYGLPSPLLIGESSPRLVGNVTGIYGALDSLDGNIERFAQAGIRLVLDRELRAVGTAAYERMRIAGKFLPEEYAAYTAATYRHIIRRVLSINNSNV